MAGVDNVLVHVAGLMKGHQYRFPMRECLVDLVLGPPGVYLGRANPRPSKAQSRLSRLDGSSRSVIARRWVNATASSRILCSTSQLWSMSSAS